MARRKKGLDVHGWLVVDKPLGVTSAQVVAKARWALEAKKAGHAGTLDPQATGVLAIAFGEATKTVPYVTDSLKFYRFTVRWGQATSTDDSEGEVIETAEARPTADEIRAALPAFTGEIQQVPPKFSAVKVDGERAYALARGGEDVELEARPLWVESLDLVDTPDAETAIFEMVCGKGGYVRAIARDLGRALGCLGHVVQLRRIWSGPFDESDAISFETLDEWRHKARAERRLLPVSTGLDDIPALAVTAAMAAHLCQGRAVPATGVDLSHGDEAWASFQGTPVAVGVVKGGLLHPGRVFNLMKTGETDVDHC